MPSTDTTLLAATLAWIASGLPQLAAAVALVIAGAWLARMAERALLRVMDRQLAADPTLRGVLGSVARYAVLLLFLIAALGQLGFQMSSVLAVLATAGLAIGLALQATLSNIAAGLMLLWLRPFRVGDSIEVGPIAGRVVEVGLFASEIHTADGLFSFVPNAELWNKRLVNYTRLPRRQVTVRVGLKDLAALERLRAWHGRTLASDPRVLAEPPSQVVVVELAHDRLAATVQAWTLTQDHAGLARDIADQLPTVIWPGLDETEPR
jgi:small conductance mechanosensitive channel